MHTNAHPGPAESERDHASDACSGSGDEGYAAV
jgi:hypothetical protein